MDIYDGAGTLIADDRTVNTDAAGSLAAAQHSPDVAANAAGDRIAVVWTDSGLNISDIRCRVYNQIGDEIAAEFTVNTTAGAIGSEQAQPAVTWLDNEKFVVAWASGFDGQGDPSDAIKYAIYSATGTLLVPEQLANTTTRGSQQEPAITVLPDGGFAIAWSDDDPASFGDIRLQVFDGNGEKRGTEILVNSDNAGQQLSPALATLSDGRIVVTWQTSFGDISAQIIDPRDGLVYGTTAGETLYGNESANDEINCLDGDDFAYGLGGSDQLFGGAGKDQLFGQRGDDTLYGGAGDDTLRGNNGDDALFGEDGNDVLVGNKGDDELDGGAGTDAASYQVSTQSVVAALDGSLAGTNDAAGDTFVRIENLIGANLAGAGDTLVGNGAANALFGLNGDDTLRGGAGSDGLIGGLGADTLTGGTGNDRFVFQSIAECGDTITDFSSYATGNNDVVQIRASAFGGGLAANVALTAAQFQSSAIASAGTTDVRVFYETDTGILRFDADGSGSISTAVVIATLQPGAKFVISDVEVI